MTDNTRLTKSDVLAALKGDLPSAVLEAVLDKYVEQESKAAYRRGYQAGNKSKTCRPAVEPMSPDDGTSVEDCRSTVESPSKCQPESAGTPLAHTTKYIGSIEVTTESPVVQLLPQTQPEEDRSFSQRRMGGAGGKESVASEPPASPPASVSEPPQHPASTATALTPRVAQITLPMALPDPVARVVDMREQAAKRRERAREHAVQCVFWHWKTTFRRGPRTALTPERFRKLAEIVRQAEAQDGDIGTLLYAIEGAQLDPWVNGSKNGTKHDDVLWILRDRGVIETFADRKWQWREGTPHPLLEELARAVLATPPEASNGVAGEVAQLA